MLRVYFQIFKKLYHFTNIYSIYTRGGNVDSGGQVSLQSLAPTLIKHTWTS